MPKGKKSKKGKKDKKGKKNEAKDESIIKMAERNANIWEAKLKMSEFQKENIKETARQLVEENSSLLDYLNQNEKDTIDVVAYLRKVDADKENEISDLKEELRNINSVHQADKDAVINEFTAKVNDLQDMLDRKTHEYDLVMNELNQLKDFRKRKIQMQKELDEIKEAMVQNEKEHKEQTSRIEQKFFEEKMRLQIEANKKIEELAEKAHDAAIKNLNDITRNVYKENVQLTESYRINMAEIEKLRKLNQSLAFENDKLKAQNGDMTSVIKEKIDSNAKQSKQIKEFQSKIEILEKSLSQVVREFETERESVIYRCKLETESSAIELEKVKRTLELKNSEMNKVKKLAKNILEQRSDIERFFLEALDYVKKQIVINRNEYRKEANQMYNSRMLAAYNGQMEYPKIKTFSKKFAANSTNNVFNDLEQAVKW
ncbi:basal body-orientation factor 1-like [Brachionus plicatilis]|uniref:Basal body-orientation factor 1 n=1 Tax=Brachionus plicatilis TaxID=10195 RepID=A0A3M7R6F0_BRAPC|nr:basal body-orientation factor 1-like [Brachionus plicatilis]